MESCYCTLAGYTRYCTIIPKCRICRRISHRSLFSECPSLWKTTSRWQALSPHSVSIIGAPHTPRAPRLLSITVAKFIDRSNTLSGCESGATRTQWQRCGARVSSCCARRTCRSSACGSRRTTGSSEAPPTSTTRATPVASALVARALWWVSLVVLSLTLQEN